MEEKNVTKISLSTFFLILAVIAMIVMGIFIYKLNNDKTVEIQKSTELQAQVNSLNGTVSDLQGKINAISETIKPDNSKEQVINNTIDNTLNNSSTTIDYIDFNESNYNKYSPSRISNISKNSDGTYTITSRVYSKVELPILSKNEINQLENGKTIKVFDWTLKKDNSEDDGGHDFLITSVDENQWMKFYVDKNKDGTAELLYSTEMEIAKVTDIYMRAIVNKSVLGDNVSEYSSNENNSSEYVFLGYTEEIQFENGKIASIEWTGI